MISKLKCDCEEREAISVDSVKLFQELKTFFAEQVQQGIFVEDSPKEPYYIWKEKGNKKEWFATKWYRCKNCGCLWEFNYPDFPAKGFVRKFEDGVYTN